MGLHAQCTNLIARYKSLLQEVDPAYPLDKIILDNSSSLLKCLESIQEALSALYTTDWKNVELTPHSLSYDAIFSNEEEKNASTHDSIRAWRCQPSTENYAKIPFSARKEVFDCFFRKDVHGRLDNPDIMLLSRGTPEPLFFSPPNIVKAGVYLASEQNWFGYSDSLGHIETRQALAILEQQRRGIATISTDNCAVILGGTLGLHAVLTMIAKSDQRKKCVVLLPNYAPIVDDVNHLFEIEPVTLNTDFTVDMDQLEKTLRQPGVSTCILSWPHNPASFRQAEQHLRKIMDICAEKSIYCIVDEIVFSAYDLSEDDLENPYFISINSHSKTYNIPGLKLGHLLASKSFIDRFYRHASTTYGSPVTVADEIVRSIIAVTSGETSRKDFFNRYGYIRPGHYDILSSRYDAAEGFFDNITDTSVLSEKEDTSYFSKSERENIDSIFRSSGYTFNSDAFSLYLKKSIQMREWIKFIFTRHLSDVIEVVAHLGEKQKLSREDVSHLTIDDILRGDISADSVQQSKTQKLSQAGVHVPYLLSSEKDFLVIPVQRNKPNFITDHHITAPAHKLTSTSPLNKELSGKIVCIEQADPGYDWIFACNLAGLITKYGGSNSHMSIRCSEFSLPAAIGCGEVIYDRVCGSGHIELNCKAGYVRTALDIKPS